MNVTWVNIWVMSAWMKAELKWIWPVSWLRKALWGQELDRSKGRNSEVNEQSLLPLYLLPLHLIHCFRFLLLKVGSLDQNPHEHLGAYKKCRLLGPDKMPQVILSTLNHRAVEPLSWCRHATALQLLVSGLSLSTLRFPPRRSCVLWTPVAQHQPSAQWVEIKQLPHILCLLFPRYWYIYTWQPLNLYNNPMRRSPLFPFFR